MKYWLTIITLIMTFTIFAETDDEKFTKLTESYYKEVYSNDPERAASVGISDGFGVTLNEDKLSDRSSKSIVFSKMIRRKYTKLLAEIDQNNLFLH